MVRGVLMEARMKKAEFVVGLDVGSESISAAALQGPDGSGLIEQDVENTADGFKELEHWLGEHGVKVENTAVCLEATGVYGEALCYYLCSRGFPVAVEPPLKVKRAFQQSAHKNDTVDARQIAEYGHRFFDELQWWTPPEVTLEQIRVLLTAREQFTQQRIANVNALKALQRKVITTPIALKAYEQAIARLSENIKEIDQEIKRLVRKDDSFHRLITTLTSTPGIGMLLATNLAVLTNGFARTHKAKELASYAGICPLEHTSGTSVYRRSHSRRFGPSRIRKLLYLAAMSVSTHNPEFRRYYLRKVAEGKPKRLVLNNVANKLLKVVCALVRSQSAYIPNYKSLQPMFLKTA
jgi:transposase